MPLLLSIPKRWEMALLLISGIVVVYTLRVNMSVAAQKMRSDLEWTETQKGVVLSAFYWGYTLGQVPASRYVQIYGAKWLFGLSVMIPSFLTMLVPLAARHSFKLAVVVRVAIGFFESATFPAVYHFYAIWIAEPERTFMIPLIISGIYFGEIVGFALSGYFVESSFVVNGQEYGSWPSVFYFFGMVGCVWYPVWFLFAHESPDVHPTISKEERAFIKKGKNIFSLATDAKGDYSALPSGTAARCGYSGGGSNEDSSDDVDDFAMDTASPSVPVVDTADLETASAAPGSFEYSRAIARSSSIDIQTRKVVVSSSSPPHTLDAAKGGEGTDAISILGITPYSPNRRQTHNRRRQQLEQKQKNKELELQRQPSQSSSSSLSSSAAPTAVKKFTPSKSSALGTSAVRHSSNGHQILSPKQQLQQGAGRLQGGSVKGLPLEIGGSSVAVGSAQNQPISALEFANSTPWAVYLTHPISITLNIAGFAYGWVGYTLLSEMPSYLTDVLEFDLQTAGFLSTFPYLALFISALCMGKGFEYLQQHHGWTVSAVRRVSMIIAFIGSGTGLAVCAFLTDKYAAYAALVITQMLYSASHVGFGCAFTDVAPNYSTALNSLANTTGAVGGILGPLLIAALLEHLPGTLGWKVAFLLSAAICVVSTVTWLTVMTFDIVPELNNPKRITTASGCGTSSPSVAGVGGVRERPRFCALLC